MDDKLKFLWNLEVLVKMCRSKSDGPSLRVEESEIKSKIKNYLQEIDEIKSLSEEDSYDSSAEMADRNIEIITKKQLQTLNNTLKEKNKELIKLKELEKTSYDSTSLLKNTKESYEKYIISMQDRLSSTTDYEIVDRYNNIINDTTSKIESITDELKEQTSSYENIQNSIISLTDDINTLEEQIDKKSKLLAETQANLENKDSYIDKSKREKNNKRISDLEVKIEDLTSRLEQIQKDPKYIETKIKDVINNEEKIINAREYLIDLLNIVIRQPYINVPDDKNLEQELLRATQARDSFANEVEQKSYNILEAKTPEKTRIEFLEKRIANYQQELERLQNEISLIDKDELYNYKEKDIEIINMINIMKHDLKEFQKAYEDASESNISLKAGLKVALDEKREDIIEAEKIATAFRIDESDDIASATRVIKIECEELNNKIRKAANEISTIRNRLMSKKSGLIDITSRNRDKDILKELAQIVIDLKYRRQFPETPLEIIKRLEEELGIELLNSIDYHIIDETNTIIPHNFEEYSTEMGLRNEKPTIDDENNIIKRGIKVIDQIIIPEDEQITIYEPEQNNSNLITDTNNEQLDISIQPETSSLAENGEIIEQPSEEITMNIGEPLQQEEISVTKNTDESNLNLEQETIIQPEQNIIEDIPQNLEVTEIINPIITEQNIQDPNKSAEPINEIILESNNQINQIETNLS